MWPIVRFRGRKVLAIRVLTFLRRTRDLLSFPSGSISRRCTVRAYTGKRTRMLQTNETAERDVTWCDVARRGERRGKRSHAGPARARVPLAIGDDQKLCQEQCRGGRAKPRCGIHLRRRNTPTSVPRVGCTNTAATTGRPSRTRAYRFRGALPRLRIWAQELS